MMDFWHPDLRARSERILMEINEELARKNDPARVRYLRIIPTPDDLDGWVALPIVEIPLEGDGDHGLPLAEMYRYADMVAERFTAEFGAYLMAHCLFRTPEELQDPAHQMGMKLPAA
jgi:hypothetical protein